MDGQTKAYADEIRHQKMLELYQFIDLSISRSIYLYVCPSVHCSIDPLLKIKTNIRPQTGFSSAPWLLLVQTPLSEISTAVAAAFDATSACAVIAAATSAAVAYIIVCLAIVKGIT